MLHVRERVEVSTGFCSGNPWGGKKPLGRPRRSGWIILKWSYKEYVGMTSGLIWLRIGTS